MQFAFTEEQRLFQRTVREVLTREHPPAAARRAWTTDTGRDPALWKTLAAIGLVGLTVPKSHGGLGGNELDLVLLLEECGRAALAEPIVETTAIGVPLLVEAAALGLLAGVADGSRVLTVGLASSPFVADAHIADLLLLERDDEVHAVPRAAVDLRPAATVDGARRLFRVDWTPTDATLLVGGLEGRAIVLRAHDRGALACSAVLLGLATQMIDTTVACVKMRTQFGSAAGSFQAVKHHMASALLAVESARPVVHRAAHSVAHADPERAVHVSMAKAFASEAAHAVAKAALQCHGAIGYSFEHDLHLWMKRAWALSAAFGDAAWHRARAARAVLDGPKLERGT